MSVPPKIAIVVPCFNEAAVLEQTAATLLSLLRQMSSEEMVSNKSYILFVDDGSTDETLSIIKRLHEQTNSCKGISLAHNSGHQYALLAGLLTVKDHCDAAISIDADLQDDPNVIKEMIRKFSDGTDIVCGVRDDRSVDSWFKRNSARAFYRFQKTMGVDAIADHADFRLLSNRALELLSEYDESNLYLRGIIPLLGLKQGIVTYKRRLRQAGETKYPLSKMLSLSIDGITSFSARPMRLVLYTGLILLLLDLVVATYVIVSMFYSSTLEPGWASLILSIWFLGSLILIGIGLVGEYIGKIFIEVKRRPRYAIMEKFLD